MLEKNQEYIVKIEDNGYKGEGIAKINNFTIFIPNAIKGEKVKILIVKVLATHAFGKLIEIIDKSPYRIDEVCSIYKKCGGCTYRHIDYSHTLEMKTENVKNCLRKQKLDISSIKNIIGMGNPYYYRNKLQYPLGIGKDGKPVIGIYSERSHDIVPIKNCEIQNELSQEIANEIYKFILKYNIEIYNEKSLSGILRHVVIRIGIYTGEVMVTLVTNKRVIPKQKELILTLTQKYPQIKTIIKNINNKNTNVILGTENETIYGNGYIYDILGDYKFKISPLSFYQTNPVQTELLYNLVLEKAELTGNEIVFDLFCGIGTIGIFMAKRAKKVYGIEVIEDAIKDAKENAKINNINNIEFYAGKVEEVLKTLSINPDVIVIDPPRKGCEQSTIETILKLKPNKIIYVSCNPATLARDLEMLRKCYNVNEVQPVDMFPFTSHVECVTVLYAKETL